LIGVGIDISSTLASRRGKEASQQIGSIRVVTGMQMDTTDIQRQVMRNGDEWLCEEEFCSSGLEKADVAA
jgi:hypothetical protein